MRAIEEELRDTLRDRAEEAERIPVRVPPRLRAKVRGRQVSRLALVVLAVAGVAAGVALGFGRLMERDVRPGDDPVPVPTAAPTASNLEAVLASGIHRGRPWSLAVLRRAGGWCIEERTPRSVGAACGWRVPPRVMSYGSSIGDGQPTFVDGPIAPEVAAVRIHLADGRRIDADILTPPEELGAPFNVFLAVLDPSTEATGVVALAENGQVLDRVRIDPDSEMEPTPVGEALSRNHPGAVVDINENVWAHLHQSELDSPPSASPGATRVPIETIRFTASLRVEEVWAPVRDWWEQRPPTDAPDDAFTRWWSSYPFSEPGPG